MGITLYDGPHYIENCTFVKSDIKNQRADKAAVNKQDLLKILKFNQERHQESTYLEKVIISKVNVICYRLLNEKGLIKLN